MTLDSSGVSLRVDSVSKLYKGAPAVDGVSFDLQPGTFLTMLGPSGSGKTTTLNMIAGFTTPDAGSITVSGKDITTVPPHKRGIGMVFQNYALFPHMTVEQNVAFPLEMQGTPKKQALRKARQTLEMVELAARAKHHPRQLSGGQQQRVALARAVVFEPPLLLMDEPLGALDKRLRVQMQLEIMRISRNLGSTVVYVTHDQEEALVMSDQIAVYNNGKIEQMGPSRELYEEPRSLFVADFIGDSVRLPCIYEKGKGLLGTGWTGDAPSKNWAEESGKAVLVIRPEDLDISPVAQSEPKNATNFIKGVVLDVIYVGSALIYMVQVPSGEEIEVRTSRSSDGPSITRGTDVYVQWSPAHSVLVSDSRSNDGSPTEEKKVAA